MGQSKRQGSMALPPRAFYSLFAAVARWNCNLSDLAGWASVGRFDIATGFEPTQCGDQILADFVAVPVAEILPLFLPNRAGPARRTLRRIRNLDSNDWLLITDPEHKIKITLEDLVIMADEVQRFERDCDLHRRPAAHVGSTKQYDWDGMYILLIQRVYEKGVPPTQAAWVGEIQDWFVRHSETGEVPDERTIRRRITPIWKSLRDPCR